jgi:DNA-binding HxlR family transcriptional regulator
MVTSYRQVTTTIIQRQRSLSATKPPGTAALPHQANNLQAPASPREGCVPSRPQSGIHCPAVDAVKMLAGRWKLLILREVCDGPRHFGRLRRALGVSQKVLTQQLRQMEADGILRRRVIPGRVTVVEYSLTPAGQNLRSIIATLHNWGQQRRLRT